MADNKITGRAKKFDGTAIDYVSIFNWSDGSCIAQVVPDSIGAWEYVYFNDLNVGLTYVADGCEPITHGPYSFISETGIPSDSVLHYTFDGDLLDKSINALHGVKTGSANFVAGRKTGTQALRFVAGRVSTVTNVPLNSRAMTISFWIKNDATTFKWLMQKISGQYDDFNIIINSGPNAIQMNDQYIAEACSVSVGDISLTSDKWVHFVMTLDRDLPASDSFSAYENNIKVNSSVVRNAPVPNNISNFVWGFGAGADGFGSAFTGMLQDIRIYNRVLTTEERTALYNE